ncbi:MAG: hypothetical protein V1802_01560 [Candidatus Aenigmatarchaeota archaeon]
MFFRREKKSEPSREMKEIISKASESSEPFDNHTYAEMFPEPTAQREVAPLFVKVEKYKEILITIQELKTFLVGMKQLFSVMHELESVRSDALNILRATLQRVEKNVVEIDSEFLRPKGLDLPITRDDMELRHIETSLSDLQHQLGTLRKELSEFK